MTLASGHMSVVCQQFQRASPLKLLGQFHLKLICSLIAKGESVSSPLQLAESLTCQQKSGNVIFFFSFLVLNCSALSNF